MPEYFCECCNFKTPIKCKFQAHNETSKHINNMKSFVLPVKEVNPLQSKVDLLEELVKSLIKRIEILEQKEPVVKPVAEPVVKLVAEPVAEPEVDIEDIIGHVQEQCFIDVDQITKQYNDREIVDWDEYVKLHVNYDTQQKIANGEVVYELLKESYHTDSEKSIFRKMCKLIPKEIIKVSDVSRGKFSVFSCGQWLSSVESNEKLEIIITELQTYIGHLHNIYNTCKEQYGAKMEYEKYVKVIEKVFQGPEIKNKVVKLILQYYKR